MLLPTYDVFGLVCVHKTLVTPLPLQGVLVEAQIVDFCARTTISQQFYNNQSVNVEAVYVFPVDERAAICAFHADIDGVVTKGIVREKQAARQTYDRALARGDGAQLLEQKRTDVFELRVGNLKPGQTATISITSVADLKIEGDAVCYFLPTFVAPRYTPRTEADPIPTGTVTRVLNGLQIRARCDMTDTITSITSPSHQIVSILENGNKSCIVDLAAGVTQLDKDFILLVSTLNPHQPKVCVELAPDGSMATLITLAPRIELDDQRVEIVFLVDRSGSMSGSKNEQAKKALLLFLRSLPESCFFNIVGFGDNFQKLWPTSQKYSKATLTEASAYADRLEANLGGTEIMQPLVDILQAPAVPEHARQVFVLTDGEVSNTAQVIDFVRAHQQQARVFALGLGHGASHDLVEGIARAGRGTAEFVVGAGLDAKVIQQLKTALQPAMDDVKVEWEFPLEGPPAPPAATTQPAVPGAIGSLLNFQAPSASRPELQQTPFRVPSILTGTRFLIFFLAKADAPAPTAVTITARTPLGPLAVHLKANPSDYIQGELIHTLAARHLIRDFEEGTSYMHAREGPHRPSAQAVVEQIVTLGCKYQLASKHTSFVAVQEQNPDAVLEVALESVVVQNDSPPSSPRHSIQFSNQANSKAQFYSNSSDDEDDSSNSDDLADDAKLDSLTRHVANLRMMAAEISDEMSQQHSLLDNLSDQRETIARSNAAPPRPSILSSITGAIGSLFARKQSASPPMSARNRSDSASPPRSLELGAPRVQSQAQMPAPVFSLPSSALADAGPVPTSAGPSAARSPQQPASLSPEQALRALVSLQEFDGSFPLSAQLCTTISVLQEVLQTIQREFQLSAEAIATAAAIAYFETKLASREAEWQLLVAKARKWLAKDLPTGADLPAIISRCAAAL
eukprot:m.873868 g.873868  ORF g.873868 m.873868 type:complete len:910 (+) comp59792_c0_seq2:158-2887(+)